MLLRRRNYIIIVDYPHGLTVCSDTLLKCARPRAGYRYINPFHENFFCHNSPSEPLYFYYIKKIYALQYILPYRLKDTLPKHTDALQAAKIILCRILHAPILKAYPPAAKRAFLLRKALHIQKSYKKTYKKTYKKLTPKSARHNYAQIDQSCKVEFPTAFGSYFNR